MGLPFVHGPPRSGGVGGSVSKLTCLRPAPSSFSKFSYLAFRFPEHVSCIRSCVGEG